MQIKLERPEGPKLSRGIERIRQGLPETKTTREKARIQLTGDITGQARTPKIGRFVPKDIHGKVQTPANGRFVPKDVHGKVQTPAIRIRQTYPLSKALTKKELMKDVSVRYRRPGNFRKGIRDAVWEKAKDAHGHVRDPATGRFMSKNQPWDMGHKPGYEFRKLQQDAAKRGLTREEFLDRYNNPDHYRPELPSSNRSHKLEDKTNTYFG